MSTHLYLSLTVSDLGSSFSQACQDSGIFILWAPYDTKIKNAPNGDFTTFTNKYCDVIAASFGSSRGGVVLCNVGNGMAVVYNAGEMGLKSNFSLFFHLMQTSD